MNVEVDYLESKNWEEQEMRERFRWLRENDPVFWSEKDQLWVITKHEDVVFCSKNQSLFTSAEGVLLGGPGKLGLIDEGEPRHTQLRGLINKGFSPRMVAVSRDQQNLSGRAEFSEFLSEFQSVSSWQKQIHNGQIDAMLIQHLQGCRGILRFKHGVTFSAQG